MFILAEIKTDKKSLEDAMAEVEKTETVPAPKRKAAVPTCDMEAL